MPRKARKNLSSNFAHIMVQGINKEFIFSKDNYKKKYLYLLFSNIKSYNEDLISFCMMDNHAHILLHFNQPEGISLLMHNVNTTYAKWYNNKNERVGYVFRDRYKVEEIKDLHHLYSCIKYIHNNPVKAGIVSKPEDYNYSSYREYLGGYGIFNPKLLEILQMSKNEINNIILSQNNCDSIDLNSRDFDSDYYHKEIEIFIKKNELKPFVDFNKADYKIELILFLKDKHKLNYSEIAGVLNTSRSTIYRILHNA